jgi:ubiquinone biosynthesis protein
MLFYMRENKRRNFHMYFRLIELSAHLCFHTIRFAIRYLLSKLRRKRAAWKALLGQSMAELCEALGATFIKIGQILSTRCDLLPPEITTPLINLQDHIKPFAFRYVPTIIQTQLHKPLQEIFAQFDEQPISSASIASVYRARLHSGQQVAVKIRRPDIVRKVSNDLRLMRFFARGIALLPPMKLIPVVDMINELGQCIEQQLDLRIEAQNTRHFRAFFAQEPQILLPALIEEYCT